MSKISLDVGRSWLQKGDKLFTSAEDCHNDAFINRGERTLDIYAFAYKQAADALIDEVLERELMHDLFVLPIGFLYRHYLELRLKAIIESAYRLLLIEYEPSQNRKAMQLWKVKVATRLRKSGLPYPATTGGHVLTELWRGDVRLLIEGLFPEMSENDLNIAERCIDEFQMADPKSDSFRYPVTPDGGKTLKNLSRVNLRNLKDVMHRLSALLEAVSESLAVYRQQQREMNEY